MINNAVGLIYIAGFLSILLILCVITFFFFHPTNLQRISDFQDKHKETNLYDMLKMTMFSSSRRYHESV